MRFDACQYLITVRLFYWHTTHAAS